MSRSKDNDTVEVPDLDQSIKYIEDLKNLSDVIRHLRKHPEELTRDDVILYFEDLTRLMDPTLKMLDFLLKAVMQLNKKNALNKKLINLLLEGQPPEVRKRAKMLMKD